MRRDLEDRLGRLLGRERAEEVLRAAATRRHLAWPPADNAGVYDVLDELEHSMPGAVAVTARSVRRRARTSGSMAAVSTASDTYAWLRTVLGMSTSGAEALADLEREMRAASLDPVSLDRAQAIALLGALIANAARPELAALYTFARSSLP